MIRCALLACATAFCALAAANTVGPNLVQNPGFEDLGPSGEPLHWPLDHDVYTLVTSPTHSGAYALQYRNMDPDRYVLRSQVIPLEPGKAYEVSVWIKTEDIRGSEMGATVCLEWADAQGKWIGGFYPSGFKGTCDWRQLRAVSPRVPPEAASCTVLCYVRKHMTGTAWFDDVEVRQWVGPPMSTMLLNPNYRGEILPGTRWVEAEATLELDDYGLRPDQVMLRTDLIRKLDSRVVRTRRWTPRSSTVYLPIDVSGLKPGSYVLRISCERRSDLTVLGTESWRLSVLGSADLRRRVSHIDRNNILIRDGRPFFPLGMYWGGITEDDLKVYADSAFNCLMPYGMPNREQMDLAQKYGLKVIYSLKDIYYGSTYAPQGINTIEDERAFIERRVQEFKGHPALLAWYLNDELGLEYIDRLEAHQEWLEELDPDHPTWVVLYQVEQVGRYVRSFDAIGTDPYPIPDNPAGMAGDWARTTVASVRNRRPVWMVPQVFNWACYRGEDEKAGLRPPTLDEMRSMAWQCIVHGAKGLIFYSWFDIKRDTVVPFEQQWGAVKQVAAEVKEMIPVILSPAPTPQFRCGQREWLHWTTRQLGGATYLIAVNDEGQSHKVTFDLDRTPLNVTPCGRVAPCRVLRDHLLEMEFSPHGVNILRIAFP